MANAVIEANQGEAYSVEEEIEEGAPAAEPTSIEEVVAADKAE